MYEVKPAYNLECLQTAVNPVFIARNTADAKAIQAAGAEAVGLEELENAERVISLVKACTPAAPLILLPWDYSMRPSDDMFIRTFYSMLEAAGVNVTLQYFPEDMGKAPAEIAAEYWEKFSTGIHDMAEHAATYCGKKPEMRAYNAAEFIATSFSAELEYFRKYKNRKTGFSNLNELVLYPGLACLSGAPSMGKSSFCVQLADQLAAAGESVLYFSLEQKAIELISKSLARNLYLNYAGTPPICNTDIKQGASCPELDSASREYERYAKNITILESDFSITADAICAYVDAFIASHGVRPVVFIDYLQLISAPSDSRLDDRGRVDDAVRKLKRLSKQQELFILAVSNMARFSYMERISTDSFKESGLIEYTADYLLGLQPSVLDDDKFYKQTSRNGNGRETIKAEKQKQLDEALHAPVRHVTLRVIKNRQGKMNFSARFTYHANYDYFEPAPQEEDDDLPAGWEDD